MKVGNLVKVKDFVEQRISPVVVGLLLDIKGSIRVGNARCFVLISGKTHWIWMHDLEVISESP